MAADSTSHLTCLSLGSVVREILLADAAVGAVTGRVFPVATDEAILPYILYRRVGLTQTEIKDRVKPADTAVVEILCFTETYIQSIALAEAVRAALDHKQYVAQSGLRMRSCSLVDAEESWMDDAYLQQLTFEIRI